MNSLKDLYERLKSMGTFPYVLLGDRKLRWDPNDGYLGTFRPGTKLLLAVDILNRRQLTPRVVHRDHTDDLVPYYVEIESDGGDLTSRTFLYEFRLWKNKSTDRYGFSLWPNQQIQLITFRRNCQFNIYQISVAFQECVAYFRIQELWAGQAIEKEGEFTIEDPYFQVHWWAILDFLKEQSKRRKLIKAPTTEQIYANWDEWVDKLSPTKRRMPPPRVKKDFRDHQGVVQWWNDAMNTAAVIYRLDGETTNGKVSSKEIEGQTGYRCLAEGDIVSFRDVMPVTRDRGIDGGLPYNKLLGVSRLG